MAIPGPDPKFFDDLARVAGGAVNVFSGLQEQIRNDIRARVEEMATRMDLVPRDELDMAKATIEKMRKRMDDMDQRLSALEGKKAPKAQGKAKAKAAPNRARPVATAKRKTKKTK
jgi:BMFP domain-containing protein YqiC